MAQRLLAFAAKPVPEGHAAWRATATLLRMLTWSFLLAALWGLGYTAWMAFQASRVDLPAGWLPLVGIGLLASFVSLVGLALAFAWWAAYAFAHWCERARTGYNHAFWLGAAVVLFYGSYLVSMLDRSGKPWHAFVLPALMLAHAVLGAGVLAASLVPGSRHEFPARSTAT